jgi:hypothetical protein
VRWSYAGAARGLGLRGGGFTAAGNARVRLAFGSVRFVRDATVSGTGRGGRPTARTPPASWCPRRAKRDVRVELSWTQRSRSATARIGAATLALPAP